MTETVFITGANRGIGLALARAYLAEGWRVIATARKPDEAEAFRALEAEYGDAFDARALDVAAPGTIESLAKELESETIDLIISNAGVMVGNADLLDPTSEDWTQSFAVNTIAPYRLAMAFQSHLMESDRRTFVTISTIMASIATVSNSGYLPYRASKAAVNLTMAALAEEFRPPKIVFAAVHPGWVRTDMGGSNASLSPEESAGMLKDLIGTLDMRSSGRFFGPDGKELPW